MYDLFIISILRRHCGLNLSVIADLIRNLIPYFLSVIADLIRNLIPYLVRDCGSEPAMTVGG